MDDFEDEKDEDRINLEGEAQDEINDAVKAPAPTGPKVGTETPGQAGRLMERSAKKK